MTGADDKWFEVWFDEGTDVVPHWFLVVTPDPEQPGNILILDPLEKNKIVYQSKSYEEIKRWLNEDEFSLVEGRVFPG